MGLVRSPKNKEEILLYQPQDGQLKIQVRSEGSRQIEREMIQKDEY